MSATDQVKRRYLCRPAAVAIAALWSLLGIAGLFNSLPAIMRLSIGASTPEPLSETSETLLWWILLIFLLEALAGLLLLTASAGLFMRRAWSFGLGVVISAVLLFSFPFGTLIGVAGMVVLFYIRPRGYFPVAPPSLPERVA